MMLHFLNDVANDAESTQKSIASVPEMFFLKRIVLNKVSRRQQNMKN